MVLKAHIPYYLLDSSFSIPNRTKTSKWFAVNLKYYRHPVRVYSTVHIAIKRNWLNINLPPSTPLYTRVTVKQRQASPSAIQCTGASSQSKPNPTHHQVGWGGGVFYSTGSSRLSSITPPGPLCPTWGGLYSMVFIWLTPGVWLCVVGGWWLCVPPHTHTTI